MVKQIFRILIYAVRHVTQKKKRKRKTRIPTIAATAPAMKLVNFIKLDFPFFITKIMKQQREQSSINFLILKYKR